MQIGDYPILPK